LDRYGFDEAAQRAGISPDELRTLVDVGIIVPDAEGRFAAGHVRRVGLVESLTAAGIPPDGLSAAMRSGQISLDFLDEPVFERFSALGDLTFARFAERSGAPVQLLMLP
jgi:DNA-binding transcriptional MerR regulator